MNPFLSKKFRFYSFVSMVLLVFVHGYNLQNRYMQPWTLTGELLTINSFTQYFLANGIFRFRIPLLFIISGYLFAFHDNQLHWQRIRKRAKTLLLPYFIWSIIGLAIAVLFTQWNQTREVVYQTHLQPSNEPFGEYELTDWLKAIISPTSFQLWFLRCLFMYNLLYPLLLKGVLKIPTLLFTVFTFFWITTFGITLFEGEGLLFFTLGVWLCKHQKNIQSPPRWLNLPVFTGAFLIVATIKTCLAFSVNEMNVGYFLLMSLLHKTTIFSGLLVVWFGCDSVVKSLMDKKWFVHMSAFAFIIYALHVPIITYLIDPTFHLLNGFAHYRLVTFIFLPLIIIAFCIATGYLLRKTLPQAYAVLTGGRGF
jgi:fucose 4-O-acetylase-like acetyltransferase